MVNFRVAGLNLETPWLVPIQRLPCVIFENAPNYLSCKTVGLVVIRKEAGCRVKFRKTILGTNPDLAGAIDMDEIREVIAYLAWLISQAFVGSECFRLRIKTVKAGIAAQPKVPVTILFDVGEFDRAIFRHIDDRFSGERVDF